MADMNANLSPNFTMKAMCHSNTAVARGIKNVPNDAQAKALTELVTKILQPLRTSLGKPILVNSGFRNTATNAAVGGVANSSHLTGNAADIVCPTYGNPKTFALYVAKYLKDNNIKFDQLILEKYNATTGSGWVHIGIRHNNGSQRGEIKTIPIGTSKSRPGIG